MRFDSNPPSSCEAARDTVDAAESGPSRQARPGSCIVLESEPDRRVDAARTGRALLADAFGFLLFRIEINREC